MKTSARLVVGLDGPGLADRERAAFARDLPYGFVLFARNLESAPQAAALAAELRSLGEPAPLLFVDQEGGTVDRLGPLLGVPFASGSAAAAAGSDRVHENAFLMGRACRLLGFDADFAPCVDLGQPGAGEVVLAGRTFGFHAEDVVVAGMMFLHGLTRAGVASCLKHFPGLGRGTVDSHRERPVVDAHDVDLMVTDVAPFTKLAGIADSVLVGHGAYPGFTGTDVPASASPGILSILRRQVGFARLVFSDDLNMDALSGTLPERAGVAAAAGCDVLVVSHPGEALEEMARAAAGSVADAGLAGRMEDFRERCRPRERAPFSAVEWARLAAEVSSFNEALSRPRGPLPG